MIKEKLDGDLTMYELILTDINMPEMDGMVMSGKVNELIREKNKNRERKIKT